ncbi:MAG: alpha-amylase, partial [Deltaproteobacteria bacterium]|nr:alpha-amylase [Deltaproteobacteria bacterium]
RLNLERLRSMVPVELFGRMRFPEITEAPYFISLGPHNFYWLALERPQVADSIMERPNLSLGTSWTSLLEPSRGNLLARTLIGFVIQRRWFRGKARTRKAISISDVLTFTNEARFAIAMLRVEYDRGPADTYLVPIAFSEEAEPHDSMRIPGPPIANAVIHDVPGRGEHPVTGVLYDALFADAFNTALLRAMTDGIGAVGRHGRLTGDSFAALREVPPDVSLTPRATAADQSNSDVLYGERFLLKLFRVIEEGPNAELEVGRFLATRAPEYHGVPRIAGVLEYRQQDREPTTIGTLFAFVPNQGDAWQLSLSSLDRYFEGVLADETRPETPPVQAGTLLERARLAPSDQVIDWVGTYLDRVRLLGLRTAELHVVLASEPNDPLFAPEPYDIMHQQSLYGSVSAHLARTFDLLRGRAKLLPVEQRVLVDAILAREAELDHRLARITRHRIDVIRTRIHGDYHLGQVLWTGEDFVIIDFEGEPGRPLSQRRFKRNPLRDVAGMLRSLQYASVAALRDGRHRPEDVGRLEVWARAWSEWAAASFLGGYLDRARTTRLVPASDGDLTLLLEFFMLEKCIYEIGYELNNRPDWLEIPLRGLLGLLPVV